MLLLYRWYRCCGFASRVAASYLFNKLKRLRQLPLGEIPK